MCIINVGNFTATAETDIDKNKGLPWKGSEI